VVQGLNLADDVAVYELSVHGAWFKYLQRRFRDLTFSEYFEHVVPGDFRNGIQCQDVQRLTYSNDTFDLVTSTEVFEHVADDRKGFAEVFRVLKKQGNFVFSVPMILEASTVERAYIEKGLIHHILTPEYHLAPNRFWPLFGKSEVLAFRTYGLDLMDRLQSAGFHAEIRTVNDPKHAIRDARIVLCNKPQKEE
jgi:SAM-dependent methyltransferase